MAQAATHGHAVYIELFDSARGHLAQFVIVGYGATGSDLVPYQTLSRILTPTKLDPLFRFDAIPTGQDTKVRPVGGGQLLRASNIDAGMSLAAESWKHVYGTLDATLAGPWEMQYMPLVVQVSDFDYASLSNRSKPTRLIQRINRAREAAGFPEFPIPDMPAPDAASAFASAVTL